MRRNRYRAGLVLVVLAMAPPAQKSSIKFSHKLHVEDAGAGCTDCHASMQTDISGTPPGFPGHDACGACHQESIDEMRCDMCHVNPDEAAARVVKRKIARFRHGPHVAGQTECTQCHAAVTGGEAPASDEPVCHTCHDGGRAKGACTLCHDDPGKLRPRSHDGAWLRRGGHGLQSRFETDKCRRCHEQSYCDNCHQGRMSVRIHNPNYRYTHKLDAKRLDTNCTVCHTTPSFCRSCH